MSDIVEDIKGYTELMRLYGTSMSIEYLQDVAEIIRRTFEENETITGRHYETRYCR